MLMDSQIRVEINDVSQCQKSVSECLEKVRGKGLQSTGMKLKMGRGTPHPLL